MPVSTKVTRIPVTMTCSPHLKPFERLFTQPDLQAWGRPIVNPRLRKSVEQAIESNPEMTHAELTCHFLTRVQQNPEDKLAQEHMWAFINHIVIQTVEKISRPPDVSQNLVQETLCRLPQPNLLFKNFDLNYYSEERYHYFTLEKYTREYIRRTAREADRAQSNYEDGTRSALGVIRRESIKTVKTILSLAGGIWPPERISKVLLLKQCLEEYRKTVEFGIHKFSDNDFQAIADRYNHLTAKGIKCTYQRISGQEVETSLDKAGEAIKKYKRSFCSTSLDAKLNQQSDDSSVSLLDQQIDPTDGYFERLENEERQQQLDGVTSFLCDQLQNLSAEMTRVPLMLDGLNMKQREVKIELGIPQYSVSRKYTHISSALCKSLAEWSRDQFGVKIDSSVLEGMANLIKEFMGRYYPQDLCAALSRLYTGISAPSQTEELTTKMEKHLQVRLAMTFKPDGPVGDAINKFVIAFLVDQPHLFKQPQAVSV
jgi:hypothetical protein